MHKWYDPKLFDFMTHTQVMNEYAARDRFTNVPLDVAKTEDDLLRVGIDVRVFGPESDSADAGETAAAASEASPHPPETVEEETFCRWAGSSVPNTATWSAVGGLACPSTSTTRRR